MQRNRYIMPLSRDHHFGLLFCWKIREGLKRQADVSRIRQYVLYFWNNHLQPHFDEEETTLFVLKNDKYCLQAAVEHKRIRKLVEIIQRREVDGEMLQSLAVLVDNHIRYEERVLFPHLEKELTSAQLSVIGLRLQALHAGKGTDNYPDAFWSN